MNKALNDQYMWEVRRARYPMRLEVDGRLAHFRNPLSGRSNSTFPVPTWSAIKGMYERYARVNGAYAYPTLVRICLPNSTTYDVTNNGTAFGKKGKDNVQIGRGWLLNVRYQFEAIAVHDQNYGWMPNHDPAHALQDRFNKALRRGNSSHGAVVLGLSDCGTIYRGPWREESKPVEDLNMTISTLLFSPFALPVTNPLAPQPKEVLKTSYFKNIKVVGGVFTFVDQDILTIGE